MKLSNQVLILSISTLLIAGCTQPMGLTKSGRTKDDGQVSHTSPPNPDGATTTTTFTTTTTQATTTTTQATTTTTQATTTTTQATTTTQPTPQPLPNQNVLLKNMDGKYELYGYYCGGTIRPTGPFQSLTGNYLDIKSSLGVAVNTFTPPNLGPQAIISSILSTNTELQLGPLSNYQLYCPAGTACQNNVQRSIEVYPVSALYTEVLFLNRQGHDLFCPGTPFWIAARVLDDRTLNRTTIPELGQNFVFNNLRGRFQLDSYSCGGDQYPTGVATSLSNNFLEVGPKLNSLVNTFPAKDSNGNPILKSIVSLGFTLSNTLEMFGDPTRAALCSLGAVCVLGTQKELEVYPLSANTFGYLEVRLLNRAGHPLCGPNPTPFWIHAIRIQ